MSTRVTRSSTATALKDPKAEAESDPKKAAPKAKKATALKTKVEEITELDDNATAKTIYEFTVNDIKGNPVSLDKYQGHVCIIVNVASRCGHTKSNYDQFVELYKKYGEEKGLKILAFPCNQFGAQEPGNAEAICKFVDKYNVGFDMFEKINVNGPNADPLYKFLSKMQPDPKGKGDKIKWNFTKFIIDSEGVPVKRFTPGTKPLTLVETLQEYW